ncbi:hypothetical protein DH2020_047939 [Rehmannia glutinosa]|uniref:Ubiquitin-like domain-containing protein n=1 Tax=Rehmannia glutinosa TaxID=99300 RepID=A0ABR0U7D1_REHGL
MKEVRKEKGTQKDHVSFILFLSDTLYLRAWFHLLDIVMASTILNKMGSNGGEHLNITGNNAAGCSEATVEIKIKTLDSQTFTLRVDKCTGVMVFLNWRQGFNWCNLELAENIFALVAFYVLRTEGNSKAGKVPVPELKEQIASLTGVLSEQQRLICRDVEDGHTLHLVVRQPVAPSPELSDHPATDPISSTGHNSGNRVGPGVMVGTFNISDQGDGAFPDLNRIVSAVLNSFGVTRSGSGGEGIDLNQPPLERLSTAPGLSGTRNSSRLPSDQAASVAIPVESLQPPIIPDSLTTLMQYLSHLRQEFVANAGGQSSNARNVGISGSDGQELEAAVHSSEPRGLLTPESLAEVMSSARQLLVEQATGTTGISFKCDGSIERSRIQSNAIRSGALFQNLGALLLELGRAIMTLRMGQTPTDALVNAGPSVFVSSTGPNPIMVQPLPFQPGASFGSVPVGTVQHGSGLAGGSAGSLLPRREPTSSQPLGQVSTVSSNSGNSGVQDAAALDPNSRREPQVRAIPLRTMVAAVPASVGRSDSSRGSIGILYPVLARVQHISSGNSNGTRASQTSGQNHDSNGNTEQPIPDSATLQQNFAVAGENGNGSLPSEALNGQGFSAHIRGGLEQLLSTIFPGEHVLGNAASPGSGSVPSHSEAAQDIGTSQESASAVSDEGILLSNILRQIMPVISENVGAESNAPTSNEGANLDETQADDNLDRSSSRHRRGHQSQPSSKRPRNKLHVVVAWSFRGSKNEDIHASCFGSLLVGEMMRV